MEIVSYNIVLEEVVEFFANIIIGEVTSTVTDGYIGKVCFSNYYWKSCKNLNTLYQSFYDIISNSNFKEILSDLLSHDFQFFSFIVGCIEYTAFDDYSDFKINVEVFTDELSELFEEINNKIHFWYCVYESYEKIIEANAKAIIVRSLYNPKTKLGNIHINQLYTSNFT